MTFGTMFRRQDMAFVHTIKIENEKSSKSTVSSKRTSKNRKYEACLVSTTTEETIKAKWARKASLEASLVKSTAKVTEMTTRLGLTVEEAHQAHMLAVTQWFDQGGNRLGAMKAGGPFDLKGIYGLVQAAGECEDLTRRLQGWREPVLGSQAVVSWHGTVASARKAMQSAKTFEGDRLSVRTDIEIKETGR